MVSGFLLSVLVPSLHWGCGTRGISAGAGDNFTAQYENGAQHQNVRTKAEANLVSQPPSAYPHLPFPGLLGLLRLWI